MIIWYKIKIMIGVSVLLGGTAGWFYIENLQSQRDHLTQSMVLAHRELVIVRQNLAANQIALAQRETQRLALTQEMESLNHELEQLYQIDCEVKSWSDSGVPAGVRSRLRP